jgi:hypothetical protein
MLPVTAFITPNCTPTDIFRHLRCIEAASSTNLPNLCWNEMIDFKEIHDGDAWEAFCQRVTCWRWAPSSIYLPDGDLMVVVTF